MKGIESSISFIHEKLNNVLANTGLSVPSPGVVECDGTFNVVGTENISGDLNVTGSATIGGPTSITGLTTVSGTDGIESSNYVAGTSGWKFDGTSLEANTGVIGNGALANPVTPGVVNASSSNFGLGSGAFADVVATTVAVPSGCTQLLVSGAGWIDCYNQKTTGGNNGSGGDYLYCKIKVGSAAGNSTATPVSGSNGNATATSGYSALLTGLTPGGSVSISAQGVSDYGIAVNTGNIAILSATLLWLR